MRKLLLVLSISILAQIGLGQTTICFDFTSGSYSNGTTFTNQTVDANISFSTYKNSASTNTRMWSNQLRLYQNATKGGSIIITPLNGVTITNVTVNASGTTGNAGYNVNGSFIGNLTSGTTYNMNSLTGTSSVEFFQKQSGSSNRIYMNSFCVTYTSSSTNHTVTFDANGGTGTMTAQTASSSTPLTTNTFTRAGYTFNGWNTVANGSGTSYADGANYSFSADITLYAQWTPTTSNHTVTFDANGGTGTMTAQTASSSTPLTSNAFTRTGYTFNGWSTTANGSGTSYANGANYSFSADITLYAQWTAAGGGSTCISENFNGWSHAYGNWTHNSSGTWTANGSYAGTNRIQMNDVGDYLSLPVIDNPTQLTYETALSSNASGTNKIKVQYHDGTNWVDVQEDTYTTSTYVTTTVALPAALANTTNVQLRLYRSADNRTQYINEVSVTCGAGGGCTPTHTITSIAPTSGPIGTDVKITGTGFTAATTATIGGIAATVTYNSATELIVEIPTGVTSNEIVLTESACEANTTNFTVTTASGTCAGSNNFTDIIISEVYDSDANNVWYVELFNPTNAAINLATGNYELNRYGDLTGTGGYRNIDLTGTIPAGSVFLLKLGTSTNTCTKTWDFTLGGSGINENDRNELTKNGTVIDVVHFPNQTGYTVKRKGTATGPTATYSASDWDISLVESCAHLGTAPISTFSNPTITSITDQTACGLDFSVSVTEGDNSTTGDITYQWYYNDGTATTWTAVSSSAPAGLTISGATNSNLTIGTGTNNISTISGYQFYCEATEATTCKNVSNAATFKFAPEPFFRTKQSGVWKDKANWEMATSATGTWSAACTYPTAENSDSIFIKDSIYIIENPAIDPDISADQLIIETTGKLVLGNNAELHIENGATGTDFEIKGTYIDASSSGTGNGITFNNGATWSIVANANIIKTNTSSATHYRDNYETGIANIPATANWVYRYDGTGNVSIANSANGKPMYYPNLTFESTNGAHSFNTLSQVFVGRYEKVTVKGDLTIGSNATNAITVYNNNFNSSPMLIEGDLYIAAGSELTNEAYRTSNSTYNSSWREGAGFELKGGAIIEGTFDVNHKTSATTNPANAIAPGSEGVIFSGTAKQDILGGTAESFITNDAIINNTNHIELTDINLEIEGKLKFTTGKIITTATKPDMVWVKNNATTAITGGNTSGTNNYIEGKLQWNLTNGNTYPFPIGNSAQNAQGFELTVNTGTGNVLAYLEINNTNPIQTKAYCDLEQYPTTGTGTVNAGNGAAGYDGILDQITFNLKSPLQWNITNPGGGITNYNIKILANGGQDISPVTTANNVAVRYLLKNGQAYNGATAAGTTNGTSNGFNAVGFEACPNQYTLNGMTSFSKFTLNGAAQANTVLPIELLSFNAVLNQSKAVNLEWITATEINNDYFTLERSKNGEDFEAIAKVKGAGNSNEKLTYNYIDAKPYQGVSYYRLKQTDFDGQFSYSKIKAIENNTLGENMDISIYPNPTEDILHIKINATSLEKDNASYFIYDNLGKLVQQNTLQSNESKINTSLLQKGVYQLKIVNQNIDKSLIFIKK